MGFLSKFRQRAKSFYRSVDTRAGGRLPGGVTREEVKKSKFILPTPKAPTSTTKSTITTSKPSSSKSTTSSKSVLPTAAPSKLTTITRTIAPAQKLTVTKPTAGKPQSTITAYQRPKGGVLSEAFRLPGLSSKISQRTELLRTQKLRSRTGSIKAIKEAELIGLGFSQAIIGGAAGLVDLPETALRIARNPKVLKELPKVLKESGGDFGRVVKVAPGQALGRVAGEVLFLKGSTSALNKVGKLSKAQLTKLNPKYVGKANIGKTLNIKTGAGKSVKLKVVGKIPKETLKRQVAKAGKRVDAISSQADRLIGFIKKQKVVRKPIPGEADFNTATKKLLAQFDKGTITKNNLLKLNEAIKKQGAKGLLERTFFADPTGKIRPSRLGVTKDKPGSLLDYFVEDVTLKKAKPQILLFENIKVQGLPKTLKTAANKLKKGVALTKTEADKLLKFQLKKTGKFKPVGFISGESEIVLAPGEILKRVKKVGVTIVNGKRVPIVKTEVFKAAGKTKKLLEKYKKGTLSKIQQKELNKLLKKQTGFNYGISSSLKAAKGKYVSIKKIGAVGLSKLSKKKKESTSIKSLKPKKLPPIKTKDPGTGPSKPTPSKPKVKVSKGKRSSKKITSKPTPSKPKAAPKRIVKPKYSGKKKPSRRTSRPSVTTRRRSYSGTSRGPTSRNYSSPSRKPTSRSYSGTSRGPTSKSPKSPKKTYSPKSPKKVKSPVKSPVKVDSKKKKKKTTVRKAGKVGYVVYEKQGNKGFKKVSSPLSKKDAKDRLAYRLDNKISRTAKLVPVSKFKKLGSIPKKQKNYFNKYSKNLRNYKIVKGKRVKTPNTYIEKKGSGVISTRGEKRQLALNRKARSKTISRAKRKTATKRKVLNKRMNLKN